MDFSNSSLAAKRTPASISSVAVIQSALSLPMWTDVLGASARHVLRFAIVLTGRSGEKLLGVTKEADVELNHLGVLSTEGVTG